MDVGIRFIVDDGAYKHEEYLMTEYYRDWTQWDNNNWHYYRKDQQFSCDESGQDISVWQWVTADSSKQWDSRYEDSEDVVKVFSDKLYCRAGSVASTPPKCPYRACSNDDCTECFVGWY